MALIKEISMISLFPVDIKGKLINFRTNRDRQNQWFCRNVIIKMLFLRRPCDSYYFGRDDVEPRKVDCFIMLNLKKSTFGIFKIMLSRNSLQNYVEPEFLSKLCWAGIVIKIMLNLKKSTFGVFELKLTRFLRSVAQHRRAQNNRSCSVFDFGCINVFFVNYFCITL